MDASGYYFIDGKDIWTVFGMFVEEGTDDFLKYPAKKDSITRDWRDANGVDVDVSQYFFTERPITLRMGMVVENEAEFWTKYNYFIAQMVTTGLRRVEPKELGERSFYCYYKECGSFTRFTRLKGTTKIGIKFTLSLVEPGPQLESDTVFIVDEEGTFIVT